MLLSPNSVYICGVFLVVLKHCLYLNPTKFMEEFNPSDQRPCMILKNTLYVDVSHDESACDETNRFNEAHPVLAAVCSFLRHWLFFSKQ